MESLGKGSTSVHDVDDQGAFLRLVSRYRNFVKADHSSEYPPEKGRYHMYISLACPWANRAMIVRNLKGLNNAVSVSVTEPVFGPYGWVFRKSAENSFPGSTPDHILGTEHLRDVYLKVDEHYSGRYTVPLLFDKKTMSAVNNESSEIIVMLNSEFNEVAENPGLDLYPAVMRPNIDAVNEWVYEKINNGVYRCGFARSQWAYDEAFRNLFAGLEEAEQILSRSRYLVGDRLTLADVRLFPTLVRFDPVYVGHFKCNLRRIEDYPNLWNYLKDLYQRPEFGSTVNNRQILTHYYASHTSINPFRIIPRGYNDFDERLRDCHDRASRFPSVDA